MLYLARQRRRQQLPADRVTVEPLDISRFDVGGVSNGADTRRSAPTYSPTVASIGRATNSRRGHRQGPGLARPARRSAAARGDHRSARVAVKNDRLACRRRLRGDALQHARDRRGRRLHAECLPDHSRAAREPDRLDHREGAGVPARPAAHRRTSRASRPGLGLARPAAGAREAGEPVRHARSRAAAAGQHAPVASGLGFARYRDYEFHDPQAAREGFAEKLTEQKTADDGQAQFDLNLSRFINATYSVALRAEGYEADGGRGVSGEATQLVSSLPFLVGWKADGPLDYVARRRRARCSSSPSMRSWRAAPPQD